MPDSQSSEPGFESPFATVSKIGHFCSLRDAPVYSAVYMSTSGYGNAIEYSSRVIAAWLECFPEKSRWCRDELVCQRAKCKALWAVQQTWYCAISKVIPNILFLLCICRHARCAECWYHRHVNWCYICRHSRGAECWYHRHVNWCYICRHTRGAEC